MANFPTPLPQNGGVEDISMSHFLTIQKRKSNKFAAYINLRYDPPTRA